MMMCSEIIKMYMNLYILNVLCKIKKSPFEGQIQKNNDSRWNFQRSIIYGEQLFFRVAECW